MKSQYTQRNIPPIFFGGFHEEKSHAWERMPPIVKSRKVGYNTQMHKVSIPPTSMLAGVAVDSIKYANSTHKIPMQLEEEGRRGISYRPFPCDLAMILLTVGPTVNSDCWKSTRPENSSLRRSKSAHSICRCNGVTRCFCRAATQGAWGRCIQKTRRKAPRRPLSKTMGAPTLGIQWHPEAYNSDGSVNSTQHRNILRYMAKAGDAFCAKRDMLVSFVADFEGVVSRIRKVTIS